MNEAFILDDLPTPAWEAWKYTNLPAAVKGLEVRPAKSVMSISGSVDIPAGKRVDKPVIIEVGPPQGTFAAPSVDISLGEGAELTVIERHAGEGKFWNRAAARITLADKAILRHYRIQEYGAGAVCTQDANVVIGAGATYESFTLTTGAGLSRNEIRAELRGAGAVCDLYGANLLRGKQHGDTTIVMNHQAPNCFSRQFYRSVLDNQARGVFQGKIHVERDAQKTDGFQMSGALILSEGAEMDTKPELEIYADDVKCSHGATTGQLDEEALFYMRARGIGLAEARYLLIGAFVNEAVDKIWDEAVKTELKQRISVWLGG